MKTLTANFRESLLSKVLSIITIVAFVSVFGGPLGVLAANPNPDPAYSISIDTINGDPVSTACLVSPILLEGSGSVVNGHGNSAQYKVQIVWGDGVVENDIPITPSDNKDTFTYTFSATHIVTTMSTTIKARLYHSQPPGNDGGADSSATVSVCVATPDQAVLHVVKSVLGGEASASDFTLRVKKDEVDVSGSSFQGSKDFVLDPGTYVVSEDNNVPNYNQTGISGCESNGSITLAAGANVTCTITNTFDDSEPQVTTTLSANPISLLANATSTLTWSSTGATSCSAPWTTSTSTSGTQVVTVATTTTYSITCLNSTDSDTANATVTVAPVPDGENNAPLITLLGDAVVNLVVGDPYTDAGATASDPEDGVITGSIVTVNPVNTNAVGTYIVTYNVVDLERASATEVTRTVNVSASPDTPPGDGGGSDPGDSVEPTTSNPGGSISGGRRSSVGVPLGQVLGAATGPEGEGECSVPYLNSYLKRGANNDPEEVKKLQIFLNEYMVAGLPVTGFFGPQTFSWVMKFQEVNSNEVLVPWAQAGLPTGPTGYVYKTTKRWINILKCPILSLTTPIPQLP